MWRTHYTDPSGFEDTTVSTAADQLKLGRTAMADPTFAGIKTGSDDAAGGCLLFAKAASTSANTLAASAVGAVRRTSTGSEPAS